MVSDPIRGGLQTQLLLHHLHENRRVPIRQNHPGQQRIDRQVQGFNRIFARPQAFDELINAILLFFPLADRFLKLAEASQGGVTVLQRKSVPQIGGDHFYG